MIERLRSRDVAVTALALGVAAYELICDEEETISEFFDPHMESGWKRALLLGAGAITLAHIANLFPDGKDPFERTLSPIRQAYKRM